MQKLSAYSSAKVTMQVKCTLELSISDKKILNVEYTVIKLEFTERIVFRFANMSAVRYYLPT